MGFRATRKTFKLVWPQGDPLEGLEIEVSGITLGEFNDIRCRVDKLDDAFERKTVEVEEFLKRVTSWNLEDGAGQPLEVGFQGFEELSPVDTSSILRTWFSVALGSTVDRPLDERSSGGESSVPAPNGLASIPMESL